MYLSYSQPWGPSRDEKPAMSLWCYRLHMASGTAELPGSTFPLGFAILLLLLLWILLIIFYQQVASCRAPCLDTGSFSCMAGWELPFCFEANELVPPKFSSSTIQSTDPLLWFGSVATIYFLPLCVLYIVPRGFCHYPGGVMTYVPKHCQVPIKSHLKIYL